MQIENGNKPVSRKKFVAWTVGILSTVTALKLFVRSAPPKKNNTVKMLSSDGRLVEIDVSRLPSKRKKIKDEDVHTWIQRKPSL
ncbi:MAG TPA: hypothetical protein VFP87_04520 [Chitinophagaceae bacterium]|nr:hypothetical protein [Chitinophagaceae bacterium]